MANKAMANKATANQARANKAMVNKAMADNATDPRSFVLGVRDNFFKAHAPRAKLEGNLTKQ